MLQNFTVKTVAAACAAFAFSTTASIAADCQPSKWGAGDQIGNANSITKEKTLPQPSWLRPARPIALESKPIA